MITLTTVYVEGNRESRTYKSLTGAQVAAKKRFGVSPERGSTYVHDDYAVLYVDGCSFNDLFPDSWEAIEARGKSSAALPFEVWDYFIDEQAGTSRAVKAEAFATLAEANKCAEELEEYADGVHLVGVTDEAKAEIKAQADAFEAQIQRDRQRYNDPF